MHELAIGLKHTKDYYRVLKLTPQASLTDIKKAYRGLAHEYHPDKNNDAYSAAYFLDIKEAYEILSHPERRARYDEERWLAGYAQKKKPENVSAAWIQKQAYGLAEHMQQVDTYRMDHSLLYEYVAQLLGDTHIAILHHEHDTAANETIVRELLSAIRGLHHSFYTELVPRLVLVAGGNGHLLQLIRQGEQQKRTHALWLRLRPMVLVFITLVLFLLMLLFAGLLG